MVDIRPFRAIRYTEKAGDPADLIVKPYDKIAFALQREYYEKSPYNNYSGPNNPVLLIISCGNGSMCAMEALGRMRLEDRVGLLKIGTVWPLPTDLITKHLASTDIVVVLEESTPFISVSFRSLSRKG